jgi:hypothetical protein
MEDKGRGIGVNSPQDLERRALEIAQIAGRTEPSVDDRAQARAELMDRALPQTVSEDDEVSTQSLSRDPSDPVTDRGHQKPEYSDADQKEVVERLALEGVEEAQHDQMMQARNPGVSNSGPRTPRKTNT